MQKGNITFKRDYHKKDYTCICNHAIRNKNLSFKAKGLFVYLLSLPDDWELYKSELMEHSKDKRTSIESAIKELVENGYLKIIRDKSGKSTSLCFYLVENPQWLDEIQHKVCSKQSSYYAENQHLLNTKTNTNILTTTKSVVTSNYKEVKDFIKKSYDLTFSEDFYENLIKVCNERNIDEKDYFEWLINTKETVAKQLDSYLYKSACNSNVINEYVRNKNQKEKQIHLQNPEVICPDCNHRFQNIDFITRKCICGYSLNDILKKGGQND